MLAEAMGVKSMQHQDQNRNKIKLADKLYQTLRRRLTLSKLLDQGYKVEEWIKVYFWLSKGVTRMQVRCKERYAIYFFQVKPKSDKTYMVECTMDINKLHDKMAHMGEDSVCKTMAHYSIKLTNNMEPCDACIRVKARVKARVKNAKKSTDCVTTKA